MLNDKMIKGFKPAKKVQRYFDGGGLYLEVSPSGGKLWRIKYRFLGRENRLALGKYPTVSLADARTKREEIKRQIANNVDPSEQRKKEKMARKTRQSSTFENLAFEWVEMNYTDKTFRSKQRIESIFNRYVFPSIGRKNVSDIETSEIISILRSIENEGKLEVLVKARSGISNVFRYAIINQKCRYNPASELFGIFKKKTVKHYPAPTDEKTVSHLLKKIWMVDSKLISVNTAVKILPYIFVRPGELLKMKWCDVDLNNKVWSYYILKTKTNHIVPLSMQVVHLLEEIYHHTNKSDFVFMGLRGKNTPISNVAINVQYKLLGIDTKNELTGHGWRSIARTFLDEKLKYRPDYIELQLAHSVPDRLGRAYNRTLFLAERTEMMQAWADYLDDLRTRTT